MEQRRAHGYDLFACGGRQVVPVPQQGAAYFCIEHMAVQDMYGWYRRLTTNWLGEDDVGWVRG